MVEIDKTMVETSDSKEVKLERLNEQAELIRNKLAMYDKLEELYLKIMQIKKDNYKISGDKPKYYYMDEYSKLSLEYEELRYNMEKQNSAHMIEKERMILDNIDKEIERVNKDE